MRCPHCHSLQLIKKGFFRRKISRNYVQRYLCLSCQRKFSHSTLAKTYLQKKTGINRPLFLMLCSGVSLRRCALNLNVSFMTVYRRFLWLSQLAKAGHGEFLNSLSSGDTFYLDEMETIEHTKLKPVTLPLLVDQKQRILGVAAGTLPAKGHLAEISRKKYGARVDQSSELVSEILKKIPKHVLPMVVKSDGKASYKVLIQHRWSRALHEVHIRKPDKDKEQLHLLQHKRRHDPMFALNQRCAKLRSDIKRLTRRSWCTTKKIENLVGHLMIYACYNNEVLFF